jgi:hypothetical protein
MRGVIKAATSAASLDEVAAALDPVAQCLGLCRPLWRDRFDIR